MAASTWARRTETCTPLASDGLMRAEFVSKSAEPFAGLVEGEVRERRRAQRDDTIVFREPPPRASGLKGIEGTSRASRLEVASRVAGPSSLGGSAASLRAERAGAKPES